ncbi:MAG: hypothetical protein GF403_00395 [Candidatus Coatesbacteria bacterium]|nr:hypothetical protein [Candidatus Coatesbacteria bacterium]
MSWLGWLMIGLGVLGGLLALFLISRRERRRDPCRGCPGCSPRAKRRAERSRGETPEPSTK